MKALEQYLKSVSSPTRSEVKLKRYDDIESLVSPLIVDLHCEEDVAKRLDGNVAASDLDENRSTVDEALAELMDSKLSLQSTPFITPKTSKRRPVSLDQVFLTGYDPEHAPILSHYHIT